jgi:hypothetical protein
VTTPARLLFGFPRSPTALEGGSRVANRLVGGGGLWAGGVTVGTPDTADRGGRGGWSGRVRAEV